MRSRIVFACYLGSACFVGLPSIVQAQFANLTPTEDAHLHACALDGTTGSPLKGVALRLLGTAEFRLFEANDVKGMSSKLDLFSRFPVHSTDADGIVTWPISPLSLGLNIFVGRSLGDKGFLLAQAPQGRPLATKAEITYSIVEITGRYYVVTGKVHAGYLAPIGLVFVNPGEVLAKEPAPIRSAALSVEAKPLVVRADGKVDLTIRWSYAKMPLMKPAVKWGDKVADLTKPVKGGGLVEETWEIKGAAAGDQRGKRVFEVKAYLDHPHHTLAAATSQAFCYVANSDQEQNAYQQVFKAQKLSVKESSKAIAICREVIGKFPDLGAAWAELGRRLLEIEDWQELAKQWEQAPDLAKEEYGFVSACAVAFERLGNKSKRWDMLLAVSRAKETPAVVRATCFHDALRERKYELALQIHATMEQDLDGLQFMTNKRYLTWKNGERSSTGTERIFVAQSLRRNQELDEAIAALQGLDRKSLKENSDRESYFRTLAEIHLDRKDVEAAERSLDELAKIANKPVAEAASSDQLGRIAEAKGDIHSAIGHYARSYSGSEGNVESFTRVLRRSLELDPPPLERTCAAFSLLAAHRFPDAVDVALTAVESTPELPAAHFALGLALEMTGKIPEAIKSLKKAAELAPKNAFVRKEYENAKAFAFEAPLVAEDKPASTSAPAKSSKVAKTRKTGDAKGETHSNGGAAIPKQSLVTTSEKSLWILSSGRIPTMMISRQDGGIPPADVASPPADKSFVFVEFEAEFPKAKGWNLSAFSLEDKASQDKPLRVFAFTAGSLAHDPANSTFHRAETGGAAIVIDGKVTMIGNPLGKPGQIYFGFGKNKAGEDLQWPGGKAVVTLVFEAPKASTELKLIKKKLINRTVPPGPNTSTTGSQKKKVDPEIVAAIKSLSSSDESERFTGCQTLRDAGPRAEAAVPGLIERLRTDSSFAVRFAAPEALAAIGKASVAGLAKVLADGDNTARQLATAALGDIGPDAKGALLDLAKLIKEKKDASVRGKAALSILRIAANDELSRDALNAVSEVLNDRDSNVRGSLAQSLGVLGPSGSPLIPALTAATKDDIPSVRIAAACSIVRIDANSEAAKGALQMLITALNEANASNRESAVSALGAIGPPARSALPSLEKIVADDPSASVKTSAERALKRIRSMESSSRKE